MKYMKNETYNKLLSVGALLRRDERLWYGRYVLKLFDLWYRENIPIAFSFVVFEELDRGMMKYFLVKTKTLPLNQIGRLLPEGVTNISNNLFDLPEVKEKSRGLSAYLKDAGLNPFSVRCGLVEAVISNTLVLAYNRSSLEDLYGLSEFGYYADRGLPHFKLDGDWLDKTKEDRAFDLVFYPIQENVKRNLGLYDERHPNFNLRDEISSIIFGMNWESLSGERHKNDVEALMYYCLVGEGIFVTCDGDFSRGSERLKSLFSDRLGFKDFEILAPDVAWEKYGKK